MRWCTSGEQSAVVRGRSTVWGRSRLWGRLRLRRRLAVGGHSLRVVNGRRGSPVGTRDVQREVCSRGKVVAGRRVDHSWVGWHRVGTESSGSRAGCCVEGWSRAGRRVEGWSSWGV